MSAGKINDAVQDCLSQCYSGSNPLAVLASYTHRLRAESDWTATEIDQVETTVRRLLTAMMGENESD
jgi:hypothetical protein